jgi:hypothetical protein
MHPLQQSFGSKLAQITANRVFGQTQFCPKGFGNHLPILAQPLENQVFAVCGQHGSSIALHEFARIFLTLHEILCMVGFYESNPDDFDCWSVPQCRMHFFKKGMCQ